MSDTPDRSPEEVLSVLEGALRDALGIVGPERVLRVVADAFPPAENDEIEIGIDKSHASRRHWHGRVQKVSVSMPEDLTAAIRERVGAGAFSRYVSEAAEQRIRTESLGELLAEMDEIYGPIPQELHEWADRQWAELEEE